MEPNYFIGSLFYMRLIVLTFDRLPARMLACYGNEWIETPAFDQLAARSTVFEQHFAELPGESGPAHPWWTGKLEYFDLAGQESKTGAQTTVASLVTAGVNCRLITERAEGLPLDAFSSWEQVEVEDSFDMDHAETPFAKLVQRALEVWETPLEPGQRELLWLHSRGVPSPWIPPRVFADLYLNELEGDDEEEEWDEHTGETVIPETPFDDAEAEPDSHRDFDPTGILRELTENPALAESILSEAPSPNEPEAELQNESGELERLVSRYIFAGYVSLLDHWIGRLVRGLEEGTETPADSETGKTVLVVTAASGHVVGDRRAFIEDESELCDEQLQTPMVIHEIGSSEFGIRSQSLSGPQDLFPALTEILGIELAIPFSGTSLVTPNGRRDSLLHLSSSGELAYRDREWLLILPDTVVLQSETIEDEDELQFVARLYALPDDLWQVNDVSSRRGDVVLDLARKLQSALRAAGHLRT
jgi:arylsulfatase A-like enzyme